MYPRNPSRGRALILGSRGFSALTVEQATATGGEPETNSHADYLCYAFLGGHVLTRLLPGETLDLPPFCLKTISDSARLPIRHWYLKTASYSDFTKHAGVPDSVERAQINRFGLGWRVQPFRRNTRAHVREGSDVVADALALRSAAAAPEPDKPFSVGY